MASGASPSDASPCAVSPSSISSGSGIGRSNIDVEKKRARDRKSQQAMRDRAKWTMGSLSDQIAVLTRALEEQAGHTASLGQRVQVLETENEHLRVQNAALRLSILGDDSAGHHERGASVPPWHMLPNNTPPMNISDQILQNIVSNRRRNPSISSGAQSPFDSVYASYSLKPNLCTLIKKDLRAEDEISNVVGDIVRSYTEIEALPNQVAVAYVMTLLLKWMVLLDEPSWNQMPIWLRPTKTQLTTAHPTWIDRMPWPKMRDWLIAHPEVTLDDFAAAYSSSFYVRWQYDPSHVLITVEENNKMVITNPVFEEHICQLKNWAVGDKFRSKFPELSQLTDEDAHAR